MSKITAILITKNESQNIGDCLETLRFCDQIIVVDSNSLDGTYEIAKNLGCSVIQTDDWPGFGEQKQRALNLAKSEWVLSIDADERVTPELASEIVQAVKDDSINGYFINRRSWFLGRWMHHGGWSPDYVLRLARRKYCQFGKELVHEKLFVDGTTKKLKNTLLHYSYRSVDDALTKQKRYALAGALNLSARKQSKGGIVTAVWHSVWTFFRLYLIKFGFLDGSHGFLSAILKSQEVFWKYVAIDR